MKEITISSKHICKLSQLVFKCRVLLYHTTAALSVMNIEYLL